MKLKYYLRGLAVGILLATIILSVANADRRPLTDAQIRQRALELGMTDGGSAKLSSLESGEHSSAEESKSGTEPSIPSTEESKSGTEPSIPSTEESKSEAESSVPSTEESKSEAESSVPSVEESKSEAKSSVPSVEESKSEAESRVPSVEESKSGTESSVPSAEESESGGPATEPIVFQIRSGASSYTVSRDLAALGLVEDAAAFDSFLCNNGYSKRIRVGTYKIMPDATEEEIAGIIAGS